MRRYWPLAVVLIAGATVGALAAPVVKPHLPEAGAHGAWYASRAAGLSAYLFLWASLASGLLMSSAWFDGIIGRARLLAIHQSAGIAGVLLGFGHALVLIPDGWTDFTFLDLFVPFVSDYQRLEVAAGVLALHLSIIVSFSFWFRSAIGPKTWRWVHRASFVAFAAAVWHGVSAGTDSGEAWGISLYATTALLLVFGVVVRVTYSKARPAAKTAQRASAGSRPAEAARG